MEVEEDNIIGGGLVTKYYTIHTFKDIMLSHLMVVAFWVI